MGLSGAAKKYADASESKGSSDVVSRLRYVASRDVEKVSPPALELPSSRVHIGGIILDASRWPLLLQCSPPILTEESLLKYLGYLNALCASQAEPFAMVSDLRKSAPLTVRQRKILADSMDTSAFSRHCRGMVLVLESPLLRGMVAAIHLIRRPSYAHKVVGTVEEGIAWAEKILAKGEV